MRMGSISCFAVFTLAACLAAPSHAADGVEGYYTYPALSGNTVVFTAEGDLWRVSTEGGLASRITTHPGPEVRSAISRDGRWLAFSADYEGPTEVYVMPLAGGLPKRLTFEGGRALVAGWTPSGRVLYSTSRYTTLPGQQLGLLDPTSGARTTIALAEAAEGSYDPNGGTLFFTRWPWQGSYTKRYHGGTAQKIYRFDLGSTEAINLTADYDGTSRWPMCDGGRVYFVSDRDGWMNIWSMTMEGGDLRQHTHHQDWDVKSPSLSTGRIVYQLGADLWLLDLSTDETHPLRIRLATDLDQVREHWVEQPGDYLSAAHLSPDGDRVALTARGQVFVAPAKDGRVVRVTRRPGVRDREARFSADGRDLFLISDESGENEVWKRSADGLGVATQITRGGSVLRFEALPSPDGKWVAFQDKNQELWVYNLASRKETRIAASSIDQFSDLRWSSDSRWLAFVGYADNFFTRVFICDLKSFEVRPLTSDRWNSSSPTWSADGAWLYFLSDRDLRSVVPNPWGTRHPEPFLDRPVAIYALSLRDGSRFPFLPNDELHPPEAAAKDASANKDDGESAGAEAVLPVTIDWEGLAARLYKVPVEPGNLAGLAANADRLFVLSRPTGDDQGLLLAVEIGADALRAGRATVKSLTDSLTSFELSADGQRLLLRKGESFFVVGADIDEGVDLSESAVDLGGWDLSIDPRAEWRDMFLDAWRLERDYFYDRGMNGVDWPAMRDKYLPLVERITCRDELSDILGELIGELSALHMYVYGGEFRRGEDDIDPASLGAVLRPDSVAGGWVVEHVYRTDPDEPGLLSPLARPEIDVRDGDVIEAINGVRVDEVRDAGQILRDQAGRQVRLRTRREETARDLVVRPITTADDWNLRYSEWEYTRRLAVEEAGKGDLGYVHLRAMGTSDYAQWARDFYPVWNRKGLILDLRHNNGGNIDSWILNRLLRPAWMWWQPRVGAPYSNMQTAFIGHLVVLCDEETASDGEAATEGIRRLGLGKVIGTRTWGGEIWLTSSNNLVDGGIATAAEFGVYGNEGKWLIEGHGVDPDIEVDNLPHASFGGGDAQLEAAIKYLEEQIARDPVEVPKAPSYPNKAVR